MQFIFPLILIVGSLGTIIYLFSKKWRNLSLLDVDSIPQVVEGKRKNEYIKRKVEDRAAKSKNKLWQRIGVPLLNKFAELQVRYRKYVGKIEKQVFGITQIKDHEEKKTESARHVEAVPVLEDDDADVDEFGDVSTFEENVEDEVEERELDDSEIQNIDTLLKQAQTARSQGDWDLAERKYISALGIDAKNAEAYRGLADVYSSQEQYPEAKETYEFLLQLTPNDDAVYVKLGELALMQDQKDEAIECYQQAVLLNPQLASRFAMLAKLLQSVEEYDAALEAIHQAVDLEPENATYLDNYADLAIIVSNKKLAEKIVQQLRMLDPEHPKLDMLNGRIAELEDEQK